MREGTGRTSRDVGVMGTEATASWRGRREQGSPTTAHKIMVMPWGALDHPQSRVHTGRTEMGTAPQPNRAREAELQWGGMRRAEP